MIRVLLIEEQIEWRTKIAQSISSSYEVVFWPNHDDLAQKIKEQYFDVIILSLDYRSPQQDGFELLKWFASVAPYTPIITTSVIEKADIIVQAMKMGASDFIKKPFPREKMELCVEKALETRSLKLERDYLRRQQNVTYDFDKIIALSASMKRVVSELKKFSQTDSTILITGETGTGKSFFSGSIHFNSSRKTKPFIKINCANIPETLLESELFGHEKGAFTGANKTRIGRLEQGNGGTVFLDEIGELTPQLQAKLLGFLEEKKFQRLGSNKTIHSDVRVIAATNRNLQELVAQGQFREDLFYRINVLHIHLPPLRERQECIIPLLYLLLERVVRSVKKKVKDFSPEVIEIFKTYSWPGNIRQLANTIERAVILEETSIIHKESAYIPEVIPAVCEEREMPQPPQSLQENEKEMIIRALRESNWIQKKAAEVLGISPRVLNYKIKNLGIRHSGWRKNK